MATESFDPARRGPSLKSEHSIASSGQQEVPTSQLSYSQIQVPSAALKTRSTPSARFLTIPLNQIFCSS
jgi:hypothetical protein